MSDGTPDLTPLAASPDAGTDVTPVEPGGGVVARYPEPPISRFWAKLDSPFGAGFLLTLGGLGAFAIGIAFVNLSTIFIYIAFAMFAALGLDPVIKWFERHKVKRGLAVLIVFFVFALIIIGLLWLVIPTLVDQISAFVTDLPETIADFENSDFFHWLEGIFGAGLGSLVNEVETFLTDPANLAAIGGGALKIGASIATAVSGGLIVVVLTLYFVLSLAGIKASFVQFAAARNRPKARSMIDQITESVGGYLMGMVILAFCNSVIAFTLHLILGLPFPLLMGVLAFAITIIPLVGPVLYWITATILALFTSPLSALIFAICYLIYIQIEAYVLTPKVMSKAIAIPGSLVVIGALIGGTLLGLLGALIAIPVTASILLIIKQVFLPRQDAKV
ncbi:MAG TPA: AI-2E family transporter [Microbacterium sp.]|uniref:AI-2E family transporter n=1 Tax=Microbacterium sp. TaxID=51671 RepID=UPI002BF79B87|nr:AI-2E family transporter [Microbacterium sp.]HWI31164.1 AI-2E family transporter [Microbacterium sp.]